jgi:hypothetical protein
MKNIIDVTEQKRLNEARGGNTVEEMGAVSQRKAVGYGTGGLQFRRNRLGLFHS